MNEKAQSTHLRVAVVQYDAIAALHRHHRRPVGARGGSLDASSVPPERDARAVAVGRHAHTANTTTLALRAVSDDAPTAVGERLCLEEGRRRGKVGFLFFSGGRVVLVEFLARERSRGFENFLGAANSLQKHETNDGLFWVYFARYMTPRPQRPRPRREVVVVLDRAADSCARQARDSRAQALDVRPRPRDVLAKRARARGDRARRFEFAVRTPVTGIGGAQRI